MRSALAWMAGYMVNLSDGDWLSAKLDDDVAIVCAGLVADASLDESVSRLSLTCLADDDDCVACLCDLLQEALCGLVHVCRSLTGWSGAMCLRCFVYCKRRASPDLVVLLGYILGGIVVLWCTNCENCNV